METNTDEFARLRWLKFPVLDDGFVCLVDRMGDDSAVAQAARVSYGAGTKQVSDDRGLVRYLMRHHHTTPFEMAEIKLLVRVPMDCWRQWIRTRTASVNERSSRYSVLDDGCQATAPDAWRKQATNNKQGSEGFLDGRETKPGEPSSDGEFLSKKEAVFHRYAREVYEQRLSRGVAKEQARKDLPLSQYTEAYWKIDLHNLLHFLRLRMDSHAQLEIRQYATTIGEQIVKPLFPHVWEAFEDYRLNAMTLSHIEICALASFVGYCSEGGDKAIGWETACEGAGWPKEGRCRERDEFRQKLVDMGCLESVEG